MSVICAMCYIERVVCYLILVGDGCGDACRVQFAPLAGGVFSFDWSCVLERDGSDYVIMVPKEGIGCGKYGYTPNMNVAIYKEMVGKL